MSTGKVIKEADIMQEGMKHDIGKLRYELISPYALKELAQVLTYGAEKYGDRNWEGGISYSRIFGAILRHIWDWRMGQVKDPDSGLHPLAHVFCDVMMLLHYELNLPLYSKFNNMVREGNKK